MSLAMEKKMAERAITGLLALERLATLSDAVKGHSQHVVAELLLKLERDISKHPKLAQRLRLRSESMLAFPGADTPIPPVPVPPVPA